MGKRATATRKKTEVPQATAFPSPAQTSAPGAAPVPGVAAPGFGHDFGQISVLAPQTRSDLPAAPAVQRTPAITERPAPGNTVQRGIWDRITNTVGDWLDIRDNEAQRDEWEDYQEASSDLRDFLGETHIAKNFQSTTRLGLFDAVYDPAAGTLGINVKCKFNFVSGSATEFPNASAADLAWTDQKAMDDWKARFMSTVSGAWSGNHIFYCQKPWWESLRARVAVNVSAVDANEHFALTIAKIPTGEFRTSSVSSPTMVPLIGPVGGSGDFDSNDLDPTAKPGGTQTPAVHEAGHMLGLDDEYGTGTPAHSDLVQSEFGHGVARGSDGRIMSGGSDIQPEHGVTFLEALKEATDVDEWTATMCPVPRAIPSPPSGSGSEGPGDFPLPRPRGPQDAVPV